MTHSERDLGLVACAQGLPSLVLPPFTGVIVERFPRRMVLIWTQAAFMILAFTSAALQFTNSPPVWPVVMLSFGVGIVNALDAPARQIFVIEMVGKESLSSGIVLNAIMFNSARVVGPALGGLALKNIGPAWCFFLNGLSFIAVIFSLAIMVVPHAVAHHGRVLILQPLKEGFNFARTHHAILPLLMMSVVTSV